jgi:predicted nucleotidyltransferase
MAGIFQPGDDALPNNAALQFGHGGDDGKHRLSMGVLISSASWCDTESMERPWAIHDIRKRSGSPSLSLVLCETGAEQLDRGIEEYVHHLTGEYPAIDAVWLVGSRANDRVQPNSDWDLLVFADEHTLQQMRADTNLRERSMGVDLLIVHDGTRFQEPWPSDPAQPKRGNLAPLEWHNPSGWGWQEFSDKDAEYTETRPEIRRAKAHKLWPAP